MLTPSERNLAEQHLAQSERAVADGIKLIALQQRIVATLREGNRSTAVAEELLKTLIDSQTLHEGHRDRLRNELGLS